MSTKKKQDAEIINERKKAWVGDAVLGLFMREYLLKEYDSMDGKMLTRCTSNNFLRNIGNATSVEAHIGKLYYKHGLHVAFSWIEKEILPIFLIQEKNYMHRQKQLSSNKKRAK